MKALRCSFIVACLLFSQIVAAKDLTLREVRDQLQGKEILIMRNDMTRMNSASAWYRASWDEASRTSQKIGDTTESILGNVAVVVSIDEESTAGSVSTEPRKDVFGKPIETSRVANPEIRIIAKLKDADSYVAAKGYYRSLFGQRLLLFETAKASKLLHETELNRLVGKSVYNDATTTLFPADASLSELLDFRWRQRTGKRSKLMNGIENLSALKVVDAKYVESETCAIIKLELPNGEHRLLFVNLSHFDHNANRLPWLERSRAMVSEKIPREYSAREIQAIKAGTIFRGMSKSAMYASWGFPEKTNDWGQGGEQLVYGSGQYVYVRGGVVRDWQKID